MATLTHPAPPAARLRDPRRIAWGVVAVYVLMAFPFSVRAPGTSDIGDAAMGLGFLTASVVSILRWRRTRQVNDALTAIAFTLPLAGLVTFVSGVVDSGDAVYSWVDLFFLAAYPMMALALLLFPKPPATRESRTLMMFNGIVTGASTAAVIYLTVGIDLLDRISQLTSTQALFASLYLGFDISVIGVVAGVLIRRSMISLDPRTGAMTMGLFAITANDLHFAYSATRGLIDPAYQWLLPAVGAFVFVALYPDRRDTTEEILRPKTPVWLRALPFLLVGLLSAITVSAYGMSDYRRAGYGTVCLVAIGSLVLIQQLILLDIESKRVIKARKDLISTVSHEVRTPLSAIVASYELLSSRAVSEEEAAELVELGRDQANHLRGIIEDMVDLTRGSLANKSPDESTVSGVDVIVGAMQRVGTLDVDVAAPDDIMITCDERRIQQALGELLENATSFGSESIMVLLTERNGNIRIEVHDDGPGIPLRFRQVIWDPFERAEHRLDARIQGGGLGLALVQAVARAHGGSAGYRDSEILGGSAFSIELPGRGFRRI